MRTRPSTTAFLAITMSWLLLGCGGDNEQLRSRLETSRLAWRELAQSNGETYSYATEGSSWTGYKYRSVLQITSGIVSFHGFQSSMPSRDGTSGTKIVQWEERDAEVGSHGPAATLDDLYSQCASQVLSLDPDGNTIELGLDDRGILQACTYRPHECIDDCIGGVWLSELEMGSKY